jgi:hypothetical protein
LEKTSQPKLKNLSFKLFRQWVWQQRSIRSVSCWNKLPFLFK